MGASHCSHVAALFCFSRGLCVTERVICIVLTLSLALYLPSNSFTHIRSIHDGSASNDRIEMMAAMRAGVNLQKVVEMDPLLVCECVSVYEAICIWFSGRKWKILMEIEGHVYIETFGAALFPLSENLLIESTFHFSHARIYNPIITDPINTRRRISAPGSTRGARCKWQPPTAPRRCDILTRSVASTRARRPICC